jgi:multiple sugar transport system ATP-binding protein
LPLSRSAVAGQAVAAALRPEHLLVDPNGTLEGRVEVVETLGPETYVYVDLQGQRACARVDRAQRPAPGDRLRLRVATDAVRLFDAQTGRAVR